MAHKIEKSSDGQTIVIIIQDKQTPRKRVASATDWAVHRHFLGQDHHGGQAVGDIAVLTDGRY